MSTPIMVRRSTTPPIGMNGITDVVKSVKDKATSIVKGKSDDVQQKFEQYQKSVSTPGTIPVNESTKVTPPISRETTTPPVAGNNQQTTTEEKAAVSSMTHPIAIVAGLAGGIAAGMGTYHLRSKNGKKGLILPIFLGFVAEGVAHYATSQIIFHFKTN